VAVTAPSELDLRTLSAVQDRVLWLATSIVHHANKVRATPSGVKVGGHQASSASIVGIMTALYFHHLRGPDRVSVKPHAAPVLHAIEYLLGQLDERYLTTLREFGGLQSYPSRLKDPVPADFSTGSVGIGATAPIWSALAHRYVAGHFEVPRGGRAVSLVGDAELDEGAIWEALVDPVVSQLGELLWVVDLNRQSLDRVVPDIAYGRLASMFEAAGWQVITVKYGRRLEELYARPGGEALRERIDSMANEEYQRLLRADPAELRERLPGDGRGAISAATTSGCCSTRSRRPTRSSTGRPSCSPTRSRRGGCRPRGTPRTIRRCSRPSSGRDSRQGSAPTRPTPGRASPRRAPRRSCARRRCNDCAGRSGRRSRRRRCRLRSGASTPAAARPSRRSGASSSTSATPRRRWLRAW
jgi:transketolase N-terminal domain/subunit